MIMCLILWLAILLKPIMEQTIKREGINLSIHNSSWAEWAMAIYFAMVSYLMPLIVQLIVITAVIICDTVFGVMVARKQGKYDSDILRKKFMSKWIGYAVVTILLTLIELIAYKATGSNAYKFSWLAMLGISWIEAKSILDENWKALYGYSLWNILTKYFRKNN